MYTVDEAIAFLLKDGPFRCGQFAQFMGMSRQGALRHLKRRVVAGVLEIDGCARGTRYREGPGMPCEFGGAIRGTRVLSFWADLARAFVGFCYLRPGQLVGPELRTRREATQVLDGLEEVKFIVVDLEGVTRMTEAFANEMFVRWAPRQFAAPRIQAINARVEIARLIDRMQRIDELKPKSDYGT